MDGQRHECRYAERIHECVSGTDTLTSVLFPSAVLKARTSLTEVDNTAQSQSSDICNRLTAKHVSPHVLGQGS